MPSQNENILVVSHGVLLADGQHHVAEEVCVNDLEFLIKELEHLLLEAILGLLHLSSAGEGLG